jgi:hypothetical protein
MELSSLFSWNTDNLFKFLFINGIVLVVISLFYPLQKQQELELEKIKYDQKVDLLNLKISNLKKEVLDFYTISGKDESKIKSLKSLPQSKINDLKIKDLKIRFNQTYKILSDLREKLKIENINIKGDKSKIKLLIKHADEYRKYSNWFLRVGLFSFITGLIGWVWMTHTNESFKKEELKKIRKENNG